MIDKNGFRSNVGIILTNQQGQLLWARRIGQNDWQFPQGGINPHESEEQALFRELDEEVGLAPQDVDVLACTRGWLRYRLPPRFSRPQNIPPQNAKQKNRYSKKPQQPAFVGQKQKWFLLKLLTEDRAVRVDCGAKPEFDHWRWVSYWYPLGQIVDFKREVYRRALKELAPAHGRLLQTSATRAR